MDELLLEASINNDIDTVRLLLERGIDPNYLSELKHEHHKYRKEDYGTPLHVATQNDNAELVRLLLDYGADPNRHGHTPQIPLVIATWHKNFEIIELLLNHNVHIDRINELSSLVVQSLDRRIIELFIKFGMDLERISLLDFIDLHSYSGLQNFKLVFEIIELLVHHGVDWNKGYPQGYKPKQKLIELQTKFPEQKANYQTLIDLIISYDECPIIKNAID
jgi:ankyrin repeat protein